MTVFIRVLTFRERERRDWTDVRQMNTVEAGRARIPIFCSGLKAKCRLLMLCDKSRPSDLNNP
jgi:hypothetical protein